jgi:hypothetical protein
MADYRKFVAVPYEEQIPTDTTNVKQRKVRNTIDRLTRILKIILRLAPLKGYDDELRIKRKDDTYVSNSNIISLLNHCMSYGRQLTGLNELIELLHFARIDPELIINENIKAKLYSFINNNKTYNDKETETIKNSSKDIGTSYETENKNVGTSTNIETTNVGTLTNNESNNIGTSTDIKTQDISTTTDFAPKRNWPISFDDREFDVGPSKVRKKTEDQGPVWDILGDGKKTEDNSWISDLPFNDEDDL